jgi:hypothetical protein
MLEMLVTVVRQVDHLVHFA